MSKLILEENYNLPKGWHVSSIGDVTENSQYGWTTSASKTGKIKLLRTTDITSGIIDWKTVPFCKSEPKELEKYILQNGDIVISRAGSVGVSYLIKDPEKAIFASYLIRFKPLINSTYLSYFLQSSMYWNDIKEKSSGIALLNVNATKIRQILIPVAPINEQKRIVSKIEELFSKLDFNLELLQKLNEKIMLYKSSLRESAFKGELTEIWRKKNNDKMNSFQSKRESIIERLKIIPSQEKSDSKIPHSWIWIKFGALYESAKNGLAKRHSTDGMPTPVLRLADIANNEISENSFREIKLTEIERGRYLLDKNDLVCIRVNGSENLVGRMIVCHTHRKLAYSDHFIAYKTIKEIILSSYLQEYFNTNTVRKHIRFNKVSSAGQNTVSQPTISETDIPVPTISEQETILKILENHYSISNYILTIIENSTKQCIALKNIILMKAFEGKLVPQDPNDESAEVLLQKIKQEKEKLQEIQKVSKIKPFKSRRIKNAK